MSSMIVPGAPVSVLMEHGLTDEIIEKLIAADIGTVERLGNMTPEDLEALPDVDLEMVEKIQFAVNGYYSQFEYTSAQVPAGEASLEETESAAANQAEVDAVPVTEAPVVEVPDVPEVAAPEIVEVVETVPEAADAKQSTEGEQS